MQKHLTFILPLIALVPLNAFGAMLEKYPSHGFLTGDIDRDFIEYECNLRQDSKLACSFEQISIRHKDSNLEKHQDEALAEFRQKIAPQDCPSALKDPSDFIKKITAFPADEQQDLLKTRDAFIKACKTPNDGSILEFIESLKSQERATCKLSFNHFEQTFDLAPNGTWTAVTTPGGICGSMFIASFELISGILWEYKSRHIDTIKYPKSDDMLLDVCNGSDEKEYEFSTKDAIFKDCRYIGWW